MSKLFRCPACAYTRSWAIRRNHRKCKRCCSEWSPQSYYPVKTFRLSRKEWLYLIEVFLRDGTILAVKDECVIALNTAFRAVSLIRTVMTNDVPKLLSGVCESDETYVGGAWKNKAIHIRRQGTKRGRGTSKQAIFGVIERSGKQSSLVRVWLVSDTKNKSLVPHIQQSVCLGSTIYTDGRKGYRRLPYLGYIHDWVDHEAGEYVRGEVHTQNLDGYWGLLKNHLASVGGIRKYRLKLFIGEHVWRFNHRNLTRKQQTENIYQLLIKFGGRF